MRSLRSLSIQNCKRVLRLPDFHMTELKHLYLALPELIALPDSIENLGVLQSLTLESCHLLGQLPAGIDARLMPKLQHIAIHRCPGLRSPPTGFLKWLRQNQHVYQLCPDAPPADVDIILFHGFQMPGTEAPDAYWRTWKMRESEDCWLETLLPELLVDFTGYDQDCPKAPTTRVLSISYESRLDLEKKDKKAAPDSNVQDGGVHDGYKLAENLIRNLIFDDGVNAGQNRPVFLLGHDLGGILIKLFVIAVEQTHAIQDEGVRKEKLHNFLRNLKAVHFFATPHSGAPVLQAVADSIKSTPGTLEHEMLHYLKVLNKHTARINHAFDSLRRSENDSRISDFTTCAVIATNPTNLGEFGKSVLVVEEGAERVSIDSFYSYGKTNHFTVCQPEGKHSSPVRTLAQEIIKTMEERHKLQPAAPQNSTEKLADTVEVRDMRLKYYGKLVTFATSTSDAPAAGTTEAFVTSTTAASASSTKAPVRR
ncbi:hypothetical protein R1sor_015278 [Riccia sorocarpa]|uniref:Uncharacterized protein n=1 Tax=Riccia sorocarpa TaxID=122646 RepID=A0ABD3HHZ5_9MARC